MSWLIDPFDYEFFVRALLAGITVGAMCGAVGPFILVRRMSYIGLGLSYAILGGVAVGFFLGVGLYVGALATALVSAFLIDRIRRINGLHADAAIGIVSSALFAVGVAVISANRTRELNLENLLFGNVLGVSDGELVLLLGTAAAFTVLVFLYYKPLLFSTFDREVAAIQGVRTGITEALFNLLIAGVVVVSLRVLGVLLIAAVLVLPAAFARLLSWSFGRILGISTMTGVVTAVGGLYISYHADIASGPAIVLVQAGVFTVAAIGSALLQRRRLVAAALAPPRGTAAP